MNSDTPRLPQHRRRLWPWLAAAASGGLLAACFPPLDAGGLAFLALTPLLSALWLYRPVKRPGLFRFLAGYLCGVIYFTGTFWWIGQLSPLYGTIGLRFLPFLLSLYLALFPAVWAWFAGWIVGGHFHVEPPDPLEPFSRPPLLSSLRNLGIAIVLAAAWTALEWVRGWLLTGFGWNGLGVSLYGELALIQIAEFTGVGGLSFLLVMCNVIGVVTILRLRAEIGRVRLRPHFDFAITIALVVGAFAYGVRVLTRPADPAAPVLRVAAVHPNIPQLWRFGRDPLDPESDPFEKIRQRTALRHLTAAYGRVVQLSYAWNPLWPKRATVSVTLKPQLVVWPEAAIPGGMFCDKDNYEYVMELVQGVPALLLGTDDANRDGIPGNDHNSAALVIRGHEQEIQVYDKMHLVPFGEYLPLRPFFRWLPQDMQNGDFLPGTEPKVFNLPEPGVKLAPLVCFEDTDGNLARKPVLMGAQILVNVTNDAWFATSSEAYHHLQNSIFRCVENRRPMVRATNIGVTGQVDAYGRVEVWAKPLTESPLDSSKAQHDVRYERSPGLTFYSRHGEIFSILCAGLALAALVGRMMVKRGKRGAARVEMKAVVEVEG